jgi:formate dehydrogenase subunit gamma
MIVNDDVQEIRAPEEAAARYAGRPEALLVALLEVQGRAGYISPQAVSALSKALGVTVGDVQAVISFYTELRTGEGPPPPHRVLVCRGDSCAALGSQEIVESLEEHLRGDGSDVHCEAVYCLGNCALSPSVSIDGEVYGRVDAARVVRQLEAARGAAGD